MNEWDGQEQEGLEILMTCPNELAAQEIRSTLEGVGIPAFVFEKGALGLSMSDIEARFGGVQVQVPAGRVEEARSALALVETDAARINWDEVDVGDTPEEVAGALASYGRFQFVRRLIFIVAPIIGIAVLLLAAIGFIIILAT